MAGIAELRRFLRTDSDEAGCEETFALIDDYVERELADGDASARYPGIAAHLQFCQPCRCDYDGLLHAAARR
jgi:hypothetical protein